LGIHQAFDFCADGSPLCRSNPDPENIPAAGKRQNLPPEQAHCKQHSPARIHSNKAARMVSVGIWPCHNQYNKKKITFPT
ncbi:hypothetical protein ACVGWS_00340, partial [Enterobacter hormaechei]